MQALSLLTYFVVVSFHGLSRKSHFRNEKCLHAEGYYNSNLLTQK